MNVYDNTKESQLEPGYADADDLFLVFILIVVDGNCAIIFQYRPQLVLEAHLPSTGVCLV